jgi:hypothetical protein
MTSSHGISHAEYPVKACTFSGGHTNIANDPGLGDNWIAQESWDFVMQFS